MKAIKIQKVLLKMFELVSVITPMYNSERFIEETIQSVLKQTYTNWEMLIIEDGSNDNSIEIVKKYLQANKRIKLISNEINQGAALSRNIGIAKSNGRYLAFLDSDDIWVPSKLEEQIKFMNDEKVALSFSSYEKIDELGEHIKNIRVINTKPSYNDLLKSNHIGCLTAIIDLKVMNFKKIYMPNIKTRHDHGLWLAILKKGFNVSGNTKILAKYRHRAGSISFSKINSAYYQWKLYREIEKVNIFSSIYYMFCWGWYGFLKQA